MNSTKLNDWMQVVGLFGVIGSLIFVGLQMRQDRVIATVDAMSSRTEAMSEFANLIDNGKAIWVAGLNGDELSEEDKAVFHAMVEAVESYYVSLYVRLRTLGRQAQLGPAADEPTDNYAFALYSHVGLRESWEIQLEYWDARDSAIGTLDGGADFRSRVSNKLAQLDNESPSLPKLKRHVFW